MKKVLYIIAIVGAIICTYLYAKHRNSLIVNVPRGTIVSDTITVTDTVYIKIPTPSDSTIIRTKIITVPRLKTDTIYETFTDSVQVELPISQKVYKDSLYQAWISGYDARIDSIYIFPKTTTITHRIRDKPKWNFGVHIGYGYDIQRNHLTPYLGIGIGYNILTW